MGTAVQQASLPAPHPNESALIEIVERAIHASPSEWLFFRELRVGTGRQNGGAQRLDAFALRTMTPKTPAVWPAKSASAFSPNTPAHPQSRGLSSTKPPLRLAWP